MKKLVIFLLLLACMPLEIGSAESEHKVHVRLMPVDVEKKDSGNIEVIDLPDDYTGTPEVGSGPGSGDSPGTGDSPGRGGTPGTGDSPGKGDTPDKGEGQEKSDSPDTGGGVWSWLGDQVSKFTDNASNVASDLRTWGKEKASEIGEHVASAAEKTWEWVKENKEFAAITAVGVTLTVAGVFFPPLLPFGVSILAGEAISGGVSYAFGARGKDLIKEMALGGALSVAGLGVGSLAAKVGRPLVANLLASRPVATLLTAVKNFRAAAWVASGARMAAQPFQVIGSRLTGAVNSLARGVQAAGNSAVRWLQRSRVASALVGMAKGVTRQVGTLVQALRNSAAGRAAAQFGSQVARTMQVTLSRIAVPFYRQTRGSEAAAGVSSSIADDKMRGKDVSWTKAILSGGLAALLVFGGSAAQKQVNLLPSASEAKPAVVQNVDVASGDAYDVLRKHKIPTTLTDEEVQLAKQLDMRMEYESTPEVPPKKKSVPDWLKERWEVGNNIVLVTLIMRLSWKQKKWGYF